MPNHTFIGILRRTGDAVVWTVTRSVVVVMGLLIVTTLFTRIVSVPVLVDFVESNRAALSIVAGLLVLSGLMLWMRRYLKTNVPSVTDTFILQDKIATLSEKVASLDATSKVMLEGQFSGKTTILQLDPTDRRAFLEETAAKALENLPSAVFHGLREAFRKDFEAEAVIREADIGFTRVARRLQAAVDEVRNRAQLNLILGAMAAAAGLMFLFYFVLVYTPLTTETWQETLVRSIPRLSFVAIIELIGYFFLGLYRAGTSELKYFQNEITNVELWSAAYLHAMRDGDKELAKDIITKLLGVERNFILKKGETAAYAASEATDDKGSTLADLRELLALVRKSEKAEG